MHCLQYLLKALVFSSLFLLSAMLPSLKAASVAAPLDANASQRLVSQSIARSLVWVSNLAPRAEPLEQTAATPAPSSSPAILQLRVVDGEGAVYGLGSRATRGLTIQVTDETGRPVGGVAVSFRLPDDGATGTFQNGVKTEIAVTKADGRAAVWGMQWNRTAGPVAIRITASKESARAGTVTQVYLSEQVLAGRKETSSSASPAMHSRKKWVTVLLVVAGVAGGGLAAGVIAGQKTPATAAAVSNAPKIGSPTVIIGRP